MLEKVGLDDFRRHQIHPKLQHISSFLHPRGLQVQQLKDKVAELQAVGPGCVNPTQSKASLQFFAILVPC